MTEQTAQSPTAYPTMRDEVSAASLARHLTVAAFARQPLLFRPEQTRALNQAFASAYVAEYAVAALLRALVAIDPQRADEAARGVWDAWEDGGTCGGELWEWLTEYGINPDSVEPHILPPGADAKRAEALAEVDRLRAELAAARADRDRYATSAATLAAVRAFGTDTLRDTTDSDAQIRAHMARGDSAQVIFYAGAWRALLAVRDLISGTEAAATPEQPAPDSGAPLDATTNA